MENHPGLPEVHTVITYRIRGTGGCLVRFPAAERAGASVFVKICVLFRQSGLLIRTEPGRMVAVADIKTPVFYKRCTRAESLPLLINRNGWFMFCPMYKVSCGKMFEIMASPSELALVATAAGKYSSAEFT